MEVCNGSAIGWGCGALIRDKRPTEPTLTLGGFVVCGFEA
jgi:hypothetical protein